MSTSPTSTLPSAAELGEVVSEVWASFLDDTLLLAETAPEAPLPASGRVTSWVCVSGGWTGHLYVITTPAGARHIAATMFELAPEEVTTEQIADAIGEIANMVGGTVKAMVGADSSLSLPQVVLDAGAVVSPDAEQRVSARGCWHGEPLEFALWERQTCREEGTP